MNELESFIKTIIQHMPQNLDEMHKARYVYIELGKIVSFDLKYTFGNGKEKNRIYRNITYNKRILNEIFKTKIIICKSLSYIYEYILNYLDIKTCTTSPTEDNHVFNIITTKDNKRYFADLQLDLENIQSRSKTRFFATNKDSFFTVIDEDYLKEIDLSIGYITDVDDYTDTYTDVFKHILADNLVLYEKVKLIMDYIHLCIDISNMKFIEKSHYYNRIFDKLLSHKSNKRIHFAYCYRFREGIKEYISFLSIDIGRANSEVYILYENSKWFTLIKHEKVILMLKKGLIIRYGTLLVMQKHLTNTSSFNKL